MIFNIDENASCEVVSKSSDLEIIEIKATTIALGGATILNVDLLTKIDWLVFDLEDDDRELKSALKHHPDDFIIDHENNEVRLVKPISALIGLIYHLNSDNSGYMESYICKLKSHLGSAFDDYIIESSAGTAYENELSELIDQSKFDIKLNGETIEMK